MRWSDEGYVVSIISSKENSSIIKVFSKNYGCYSGIFYGSSSKKKKADLQLGNKVKINYNSKSEDSLGYFTLELIENTSIKFFNDDIKLNLLITSIEVISKVMPERQKYLECYADFNNFIRELKDDSLKSYLVWEFNFLKNIGYGLDFSEKNFDEKTKDLLQRKIVDFSFNDLKIIFNLNNEIINNRLVDIINISNFKNRKKIFKYFNE
tara:strand:- start:1929 stop:2555 length:627 start_codon:yes stop_codon:yes gene_type:complete